MFCDMGKSTFTPIFVLPSASSLIGGLGPELLAPTGGGAEEHGVS